MGNERGLLHHLPDVGIVEVTSATGPPTAALPSAAKSAATAAAISCTCAVCHLLLPAVVGLLQERLHLGLRSGHCLGHCLLRVQVSECRVVRGTIRRLGCCLACRAVFLRLGG